MSQDLNIHKKTQDRDAIIAGLSLAAVEGLRDQIKAKETSTEVWQRQNAQRMEISIFCVIAAGAYIVALLFPISLAFSVPLLLAFFWYFIGSENSEKAQTNELRLNSGQSKSSRAHEQILSTVDDAYRSSVKNILDNMQNIVRANYDNYQQQEIVLKKAERIFAHTILSAQLAGEIEYYQETRSESSLQSSLQQITKQELEEEKQNLVMHLNQTEEIIGYLGSKEHIHLLPPEQIINILDNKSMDLTEVKNKAESTLDSINPLENTRVVQH